MGATWTTSITARSIRRMLLAAAALLLALPAGADEIPATMPASEMPAYVRVSPGLATSAQPSPETLARLKELRFKTVVNIRAANEPGVQEEADVVRARGSPIT